MRRRSLLPGPAAVLLCLTLFPATSALAFNQILFAPSAELAGELFGDSVCGIGDFDGNGVGDFVVGDRNFDDGEFNTGRAYLFLCHRNPLSFQRVILPSGDRAGLFGKELGAAGDVNGDGLADFLITSENLYAVSLYRGSNTTGGIYAQILEAPEGLRTSDARGIGDFNADGYDDFAVGTYQGGRVLVYFGGRTIGPDPDLVLLDPDGGDPWNGFGLEVFPMGDADRDGYPDFAAVGTYLRSGETRVQKAYVYCGGPEPATVPRHALVTEDPRGGFGRPIERTGDVNGDGHDDFAVGSPASGYVSIYCFDPQIGFFPHVLIPAPEGYQDFGFRMEGKADVDGDSAPDLVISQAYPDLDHGSAVVYDPAGVARFPFPKSYLTGRTFPASAMGDVDAVGDIDGDGIVDLLVGGPNDGIGNVRRGRAYVLRGGTEHFVRLSVGRSTIGVGEEGDVLAYGEAITNVRTDGIPIGALQATWRFDSEVLEFLGAESLVEGANWLVETNVTFGRLRLAVASLPGTPIPVGESPVFRLRFRAKSEGSTRLQPVEGFAYESLELPVWLDLRPGIVSSSAATGVPMSRAPVAGLEAFPNPANPRCTLVVRAPDVGPAELSVFDLRGRRIWSYAMQVARAGEQRVVWPGLDSHGMAAASGSYVVRVQGRSWQAATRVALVR